MIKRVLISLVLIVVVCGGLIGFNVFRSKMIAGFFANQQMPAATISATEVNPVTWHPEIDAIGTLWAAQGVDVAAETAGRVRTIEFSANQHVEQGALLVQIDDAVERADLISAESAVERDRAQLARAQRLRETGVSSEATLEEAQTALAVSELSFARIQAVLDQKAIEAPFSGTTGIPRIDVGQFVEAGTVIATLQQLDTMKVDFTVPEQQMGSLRMGQPATFGVSEENFDYPGEIIGIDPKIDPQTRMVSARAAVSNPKAELRPGQFVRIRVQLPAVEGVIALPQTAVVTSLYGDYVYVVAEAESDPPAEGESQETPPPGVVAGDDAPRLVARQTFVEIGRRQGNMVEIVKGLEAGQTVVTSGQNKLANSMPVIINNDVDPAEVALEGGDGRT